MVGDEIVCYQEVSATEPWQLTGCVRGAFGTAAAAHRRGDAIGKLVDHGYWVFLGDAALNDEIAVTLARLCNETGLTRFAFDGIEGTAASGLGAYAFNRIVTLWYQNLKPGLQGRIFWESSIPIQSASNNRLISFNRAFAPFFVRRGNLPPSVMKSPWRVSINLSSFTSMAVTDLSLARIFNSAICSNNSTGGGSGPNRSRNSFCKASSAALSVACASLR